jgi:hypothetical protein
MIIYIQNFAHTMTLSEFLEKVNRHIPGFSGFENEMIIAAIILIQFIWVVIAAIVPRITNIALSTIYSIRDHHKNPIGSIAAMFYTLCYVFWPSILNTSLYIIFLESINNP